MHLDKRGVVARAAFLGRIRCPVNQGEINKPAVYNAAPDKCKTSVPKDTGI